MLNLVILIVIFLLIITPSEKFIISNKRVCTPKIFDKKIAGARIRINGVCFDVPQPDGEKIKKDLINPITDPIKKVTDAVKDIPNMLKNIKIVQY